MGAGPFVPSGGFAGGSVSGLWCDGASGPDGTSLGCRTGRRYSDAFGAENRSKVPVTLTAAQGPNPAPRVIDRVATQLRLSPPRHPGDRLSIGLAYRHWSAAPGRPVTIPPGRIATVQRNFLMRHCEDLASGRTLTVPGSIVLSYRTSGRAGRQKLTLPVERIILRRGPTKRACEPVSGSARLVASDIGCAVARRATLACHPMSHPTWGDCTVAGNLWDCGSFAGPGEPLLETCYLPHEKSHSFSTVWIGGGLGLWGAIQNRPLPGWRTVYAAPATGGVCRFRANARTLVYESTGLRVARGRATARVPALARVVFTIRDYHDPGNHWAGASAPHGGTAVEVAIGPDAAHRFYRATAGRISIARARKGSLGGTVYASLHLAGGSSQASLNGTWSCRIEQTAKGR